MSTTFSITKSTILALALFFSIPCSVAQRFTPDEINISNNRSITKNRSHLIIKNKVTNKKTRLHLPKSIQRTLGITSSFDFPSDHSKIIDGEEYILAAIIHLSTGMTRTGYCGSGEEGTLYVFKIEKNVAKPVFSILAQSCFQSIDLDSDEGNQSPYAAIKWNDTPAGINITWENDSDGENTNRIYRLESGKFILSKSK